MKKLYVKIPRARVSLEQHKIGKRKSPHAIRLHNGDILVCVGTEKEIERATESGEIYGAYS